MKFFYLFTAIIFEVIATTALKQSNQFSKLLPSITVILMYAGAFYFLSLTLKTMHVGIAYAIWSGVGIVFISILGALLYKQIPDLPAIIGLSLIIIGVIVINVFSKTTTH
jgi:small multidrug resistance pump